MRRLSLLGRRRGKVVCAGEGDLVSSLERWDVPAAAEEGGSRAARGSAGVVRKAGAQRALAAREAAVRAAGGLADAGGLGFRLPADGYLAAVASRQRPIEDLEGVRVPRLLFADVGEDLLDLGELAWPGVVVYVFPGCETEDEGFASWDEDMVQHRTYTSLREHFAKVIPGGAVVGVSMGLPIAQYKHSLALGLRPAGDERRIAHHLVYDDRFALARFLGLPVCERGETAYYDRMTLVARDGRIRKVFASSRAGDDARQALAWLQVN